MEAMKSNISSTFSQEAACSKAKYRAKIFWIKSLRIKTMREARMEDDSAGPADGGSQKLANGDGGRNEDDSQETDELGLFPPLCNVVWTVQLLEDLVAPSCIVRNQKTDRSK
jgi:hypothetical protein